MGRVDTSLAGKGVGGDASPVTTMGIPHHSLTRGALTAAGMRGSAPRRNDRTQEDAISPESCDQKSWGELDTELPAGKNLSHMDRAHRWGVAVVGVLVLPVLPVTPDVAVEKVVSLPEVATPTAATLSRPVSHSMCTSFCRRLWAHWSMWRCLLGTVKVVHRIGGSRPCANVRHSPWASCTRQKGTPPLPPPPPTATGTERVTQRPVESRHACSITLGMWNF